jgi:L-asparaginase
MKKILWLQTGGTINCRGTNFGLAPVAGVGLSVNVDGVCYDSEPVFTIDSSDITPRHWQILAEKIFESHENYDGFVITHGTDTLQYSAAALSFMLADFDKPVIFTGSMLPPDAEGSDAADNLALALTAARDSESGVHVAFAGKIMSGISCIKLHTKDQDAFTDTGLTCECRGAHWASVHASCKICEKIFLLKITPNITVDIADFILEKGYKGVVCEGYGLGGIPSGLLGRLGELVQRGVRVVVVSQCLYGGADLSVYAAHKKAQDLGLEAWNMTGSAALIKLMFELGENHED